MKVQSSKFKVQSFLKNLSTAFCLPSTKKDGFTLIEIIMIIVVVAIAIPALLIILGQEAKQSVNAELQVSATNVAQALMEEIKTKRWDENSPIPPNFYSTTLGPNGETRTQCTGLSATPFDDIDDYNGYPETCPVGGVSFTSIVAVCYVQAAALDNCVPNPPPNTNTGYDYKHIQVTVSNPNLGSVVLVTVVANY